MTNQFKIGDMIQYGKRDRFGDNIIEARVYAVFGDKIAIDHFTFQRGRIIGKNSPKIVGVVA